MDYVKFLVRKPLIREENNVSVLILLSLW